MLFFRVTTTPYYTAHMDTFQYSTHIIYVLESRTKSVPIAYTSTQASYGNHSKHIILLSSLSVLRFKCFFLSAGSNFHFQTSSYIPTTSVLFSRFLSMRGYWVQSQRNLFKTPPLQLPTATSNMSCIQLLITIGFLMKNSESWWVLPTTLPITLNRSYYELFCFLSVLQQNHFIYLSRSFTKRLQYCTSSRRECVKLILIQQVRRYYSTNQNKNEAIHGPAPIKSVHHHQ